MHYHISMSNIELNYFFHSVKKMGTLVPILKMEIHFIYQTYNAKGYLYCNINYRLVWVGLWRIVIIKVKLIRLLWKTQDLTCILNISRYIDINRYRFSLFFFFTEYENWPASCGGLKQMAPNRSENIRRCSLIGVGVIL